MSSSSSDPSEISVQRASEIHFGEQGISEPTNNSNGSLFEEREAKSLLRNPRRLVLFIAFGQLLSVFLTGTGVFSQLLSNSNVNIPTAQSFVNYFLLSFCLPIVAYRRRLWPFSSSFFGSFDSQHLLVQNQNHRRIQRNSNESEEKKIELISAISVSPASEFCDNNRFCSPGKLFSVSVWKYLFLSFCDVEGNYFLVRAYQYTTITSVQLLDCFTIPIVMAISRIFLRANYNRRHLIGASICLIGLFLLILSDVIAKRFDSSSSVDTSNELIGDLLVLIGCVFYAISNVSQEYLIKSYDRYEFLGLLGLFGAIISFFQVLILERDNLVSINWGDSFIWSYFIGFNCCLFSMYFLIPLLLKYSSALFMNLSFLTSDFWSVLFAVYLFGAHLNFLYFIAFGLIIIGLLLYNFANSTMTLMQFLHFLRNVFSSDSSSDSSSSSSNPFVDSSHGLSGGEEKEFREDSSISTNETSKQNVMNSSSSIITYEQIQSADEDNSTLTESERQISMQPTDK